MAIDYGASALGLVGNMPSGPGVIDDQIIATIVRSVPPPISTFLLTSETEADAVISHHQKTYTNTIQLVDEISTDSYATIKAALPGVKLVQVIHVRDEDSIEYALRRPVLQTLFYSTAGIRGLRSKFWGEPEKLTTGN